MKKQYKLKDIGAFKGGVTSIKPTDYGYGTPFITYKNIFQNPKVDINMLTLMNVPKKDLQKCSCKYGDIFFTASSEVFEEVAMSSVLLDKGIKNLTFNGFSKRFRLFDFNTLLPEYAVYYFRSREFRNSIAAITTGDIRFNVSQENLSNITITLPPLSEQKRIANILSSFDNKIEILKKENKILEDIAENIFKEWFVKYNFPNKDGKPYKDSGGKMIDSELGPIPEGWRVGKLGDVCKMLASGGTPATNKPEYYGDKYNWFTTKELQDTFLLNSEKRISDKGLNNSAAKIFPKSSVLIAIYAAPTVGRLGILSSKATFNQATCGLVANDDFSNEFIFLYLLNERKNLNNLASGAAQQNLNVGIIRNYPVPLITKITNSKFIRTTKPLFNKIKKNIEEENNLREQKKKLLQKLIK